MMISLQETREKVKDLEQQRDHYLNDLAITKKALEEIDSELYDRRARELHLAEIYRLAAYHFSRLRREPERGLTEADVAELEKWIGRAKSNDSLKDIVSALNELQKYRPADIVRNLYALVQKIIIEGAHGENKKK